MKARKVLIWTATGFGVGVAMGAATYLIGLWVAIGVAIGGAIGFVLDRQQSDKSSCERYSPCSPAEK